MKYTKEQLSKIWFGKFRFGEFTAIVNQNDGDLELMANGVRVAWLRDKWFCVSCEFDEMEYRRRATVELEAFIESELSAIELAEKREQTRPSAGDGFELCAKEQATEACYWCRNGEWSTWLRVGVWDFSATPIKKFTFRRPIAKAEPAPPDPGEGYELCDRESATEWNYLSKVIEGDTWCTHWSAISKLTTQNWHGFYAFRRPKKVESKHPADDTIFCQVEARVTATESKRGDTRDHWKHTIELSNGMAFSVDKPSHGLCGKVVRVTIESQPRDNA